MRDMSDNDIIAAKMVASQQPVLVTALDKQSDVLAMLEDTVSRLDSRLTCISYEQPSPSSHGETAPGDTMPGSSAVVAAVNSSTDRISSVIRTLGRMTRNLEV